MISDDYLTFTEAIRMVNMKVAKPDLLKVGNNFRAISESAILDAINPVLYDKNIDYNISVIDSSLIIKDTPDKVLFIATCRVRVSFTYYGEELGYSEAIGMGIDEGDKAMGKAYTYAIKYALLKKFRLQYADDPDAKQSEAIKLKPESLPKNNDPKKQPKQGSKNEPLATQKMLDYLIGLTVQLGMSYKDFKDEFGFSPDGKDLPMRTVREAIDRLKAKLDEDLPF